MHLNRNRALGVISSLSLLLTAACGGSDGDDAAANGISGDQLVFVNFGSDGLTAAKAAWLDPFSEETGVQFATDSPSDPAKVKAMVEAGNTTWDVIDLDIGSGMKGCGTLYEKRSDAVDVSEIDPALLADECGVPIIMQTLAVVYNKAEFGDDPPTSITDFLDTERFPGKRITLNYAAGGMEGMLLADGVASEELYPLDLDRAATVVKGLGSDLTLLPSLAGQSEALESGDFAMCWCYLGRAALSEENGADLGIVWENAYSGWDMLYAIKGSKYPEAQQEFLNYVATPGAQGAFTEELPYGPTAPSATPDVPEGRAKWLAQGHEDEIGTPSLLDPLWWDKNTDAAFTAWTEMTAG